MTQISHVQKEELAKIVENIIRRQMHFATFSCFQKYLSTKLSDFGAEVLERSLEVLSERITTSERNTWNAQS